MAFNDTEAHRQKGQPVMNSICMLPRVSNKMKRTTRLVYLCDDQFQKSEYLYTVRIPRKLFEGLFSVLATKKNSQRFSISTVFRVTCFILYSAGNEIIPSYFTIQDAWRRFYLD